jgi:hypothetical protein
LQAKDDGFMTTRFFTTEVEADKNSNYYVGKLHRNISLEFSLTDRTKDSAKEELAEIDFVFN